MSLNKKIKTKWFLIANLIFAILIVGLLNIDSVIKFFGGDFDDVQEILVIDEVGVYDQFKLYYEEGYSIFNIIRVGSFLSGRGYKAGGCGFAKNRNSKD